ncbi:MAG: hypothetical protein ACLPVO_03520 [Desulfomonilaceae bacterium]
MSGKKSRLLSYLFQARGTIEIKIHHESPWLNARNGLGEFDAGEMPISHEDMKEHFKQLGSKSRNGQ